RPFPRGWRTATPESPRATSGASQAVKIVRAIIRGFAQSRAVRFQGHVTGPIVRGCASMTFFFLFSACSAATYEVAQRHPRADDSGPGSGEKPWKTLAKAATAAAAGDWVVIRSGVYRERVLIKSRGTAEAPIRFEAGPGEHVLLTGADRLTNWSKADGA